MRGGTQIMSFGENLKEIRVSVGMTQEELARKVKISSQAVSKWERGESMPDPQTLPSVADALDISLDRLFDRNRETFEDLAYHIRAFNDGSMHSLRRIAFLASSNADTEKRSHLVSIAKKDGFAIGTNCDLFPFIGIFEEPKKGWKPSLSDADAIRKLFAVLSRPGRIEAVCKLLEQKKTNFDAVYAKGKLGMDTETIEDLCSLHLLGKFKVDINGKDTVLYRSNPHENWLALLILAAFINQGGEHFDYELHNRDEPLLR